MELEGKKVVIPVEEMFNTHEFWYPYYRLKEAGCEVVGAIFVIEKTFLGGRELLESHGWNVHALVGITSLDGGGVGIAD